eukprot:13334605-Ditylum_brightwellii.AAC.1
MEVEPIITTMVVWSQNWPSWVDSLDIMGCQDIQGHYGRRKGTLDEEKMVNKWRDGLGRTVFAEGRRQRLDWY